MSTPATSFRLFYPDSNTVTTLALFGPDGAALTPASVADGSGDPAGWKSKVLTFAAASEPLFATPTFQDPAAPVGLYLCREESGIFHKVLDETAFDPASPGRPTPAVTAAQEFRLYAATDLGGGVRTFAVKTPLNPVALVKALGKDPLTGAPRLGNDILLRWTGEVPARIEVECDVEDITDPAGYVPLAVTNLTSYAESSVGLSLVRANSPIVPQDGLTHLAKFRLRYPPRRVRRAGLSCRSASWPCKPAPRHGRRRRTPNAHQNREPPPLPAELVGDSRRDSGTRRRPLRAVWRTELCLSPARIGRLDQRSGRG